jgi:hypothetical protein
VSLAAAAAEPVLSVHYFVDEAGDPTLFNGKGRVLVGEPGCSRYFILGKLAVDDPAALAADMAALRRELLADPYFKDVPSMQPRAKKTAAAFHAKDDLPEVRHQVLSLLLKHTLKFYAVVRDKRELVAFVRQENEREPKYRYSPNELYDNLVSLLFKDSLFMADEFRICFSERGKSDRTAAFKAALEQARRTFERNFGLKASVAFAVTVGKPKNHAGLQAVDYFLWALQRFYEQLGTEKQEERFLSLIWPKVAVVHDLDDLSTGKRGTYFRPDHPLNAAAKVSVKKKSRGI